MIRAKIIPHKRTNTHTNKQSETRQKYNGREERCICNYNLFDNLTHYMNIVQEHSEETSELGRG